MKSIQSSGTNRSRRPTSRHAVFAAITVAVIAIAFGAALLGDRPRPDRQWIPQQAVMAHADVRGDSVFVKHVRNFSYTAEEEFTPAYDDRAYDLNTLESVWFVVTPFSKRWRGPAHTFVSFGFSDSQYVGISVEARREPGETYSPLTGLFRQFELIYVVGDERDLIGSRAVYGGYDVYVYPIRTTRANIRALFLAMLARANALATRPEFYNTLTNNCTSNVVDHVNQIVPRAVPQGIKTVLPGYADEVAYSLGLIDNSITLDEARRRFRVKDEARRYVTTPEFSRRIREQ
ncbi:MAG TPA: DUF4105 domain-containing protein [Gemmatimonadaceae bacterium]|nr:DUF4105 domain-containing protein [Gemmatimonadaceae bacterium]